MTPTTDNHRCRRCDRPISAPASVALGLGAGCARGLDPDDLDHLAEVAAGATRQLALDFEAAG